MELTAARIMELWAALSPGAAMTDLQGQRAVVTAQGMAPIGYSGMDLWRRRTYFKGKQNIQELAGVKRLDGRAKTNARTNWTAYICDMHSGFLTTNKVNYTLPDGKADAAPVQNLSSVLAANLGAALDTGHVTNALLYGYSCEIHGFIGGEIRIRATDPLGWALVYDDAGELALAIYRATLPKGTLFRGTVLTAERQIYYAYDAQQVIVVDPTDTSAAGVTRTQHYYGAVPVAVFRLSEAGETFFSDAFLDACDLYDVIRCSLADDIKYNVDALLALKKISIEQMLAKDPKDPNGPTVFQRLKEMGIFPMPEGADAGFITRTIDIEKFKYDLRVSRAAIHLMGRAPDLTDTVNANGASTSISGIALKLMFQLMNQKSAEFAAHFEGGLRARVRLINAVWQKIGKPALTDFLVRVQRNIPQNDIEWTQYIANLKDVVAVRDQLRILPFIDDPEQAFKNVMDERQANAALTTKDTKDTKEEPMPVPAPMTEPMPQPATE
jgi:SPP1 family phage portal protein